MQHLAAAVAKAHSLIQRLPVTFPGGLQRLSARLYVTRHVSLINAIVGTGDGRKSTQRL